MVIKDDGGSGQHISATIDRVSKIKKSAKGNQFCVMRSSRNNRKKLLETL